MKRHLWIYLIVILSFSVISSAKSLFEEDFDFMPKQQQYIDSMPYITLSVHNAGRMGMTVSNIGIIGTPGEAVVTDPLTGEPAPSLEYPYGFDVEYLYEAAIWVGTIDGRDTLVSTAGGSWGSIREFFPRTYPEGDIIFRTTNDPYSEGYDSAVSQQDFIARYADTITDRSLTGYDRYTGRDHRPINVEVTQSSYAWGYDYAEDFIIIDYKIANIELRTLENVYIGFYVDNDIGFRNYYYGYDDLCGFKETMSSRYISGLIDTLNVVWAADNDGDPNPITGEFNGLFSPTSVMATKVLRTPSDDIDFSFNWWIPHYNAEGDWGPQKQENLRYYHGRLGSPMSDGDKYHMMANGEFDYNQQTTFRNHGGEGYLPPPDDAFSISNGDEIRFLLSFGPFTLEPGDALPLTLAFVAGQDFHRGFNFDDLQLNTLWAEWIFDNPGVDTDGDGYKGKYHTICVNPEIARIDTIIVEADTTFDTIMTCDWGDTLYYKGDGVPDFRGAAPPESPVIRTFPRLDDHGFGQIEIRWNGRRTESVPDQFSQRNDFEGYRVYYSRSGSPNDFTLVTSYDRDNYDRYEYDKELEDWVIKNPPYDLRVLRQMYGEDFEPEDYFNEENLFAHLPNPSAEWEFYWFTRHDWNQSNLRDTMGIHKVYPDQPYPSTLNLDTAKMFYPDEVTSEGYLKYFEYRYVLRNLQPSIPYFISVSAFDHGFPSADLLPLETDRTENMVREFAHNSSRIAVENDLDVVVYPNPYRIDQNYEQFYEGWEDPNLPEDQSRVLHFTNLPHKCTIRIFSIDGDLISEIYHNYGPDDPGAMHETWNLVSRNRMAITSGIYYFSVESDYGNYVGKFVVIY